MLDKKQKDEEEKDYPRGSIGSDRDKDEGDKEE